jgi:two-component system, NtrC family, response regulator AtoC
MQVDTNQPAPHVDTPSARFIFGSTRGMRELREKIERAIDDDLPVLLEGESGTGKEVVSQFVHTRSGRRNGPFLRLNCAAISAELLEGEMFGYGRGGVAELSGESVGATCGGTLFLDQIVSMDLSVQRRLLQVLRSGRFLQHNTSNDKQVNARFVAATNVDAEAAARNGTFMPELLGCFVHRMRLLPLRDRKEDIPELCEYLLERFAREFGRSVPHISSRVLEAFEQWKWPGNIRELENWIARIVIFGAEEVIDLDFNRQLLASQEREIRSQHVTKMKMGRARRLRRQV